MAVLEGRGPQKVAWWPRIRHWYSVNRASNTLPKKYEGMEVDEVYEDIDAPPREVWDGPVLKIVEGSDVKVSRKPFTGSYMNISGDFVLTKYTTPIGELTDVVKRTERGTSSYHVEYLLKDLVSLKVYRHVLEHRNYEFDWQHYRLGEEKYGNKVYLRENVQAVPLLWLVTRLMGLNRVVIMLWKHPKEMEELMEVMTQDVEQQIKTYAGTPIPELCFSSNLHEGLCSPPQFKKYYIPFNQRVVPQIHSMGKYASAHWDGFVKRFLPFFKETGMDGVECITPKPQGDVTLEEMKSHVIDEGKFLRDGIPAILFTERYPVKELEAFARTILDMVGKSGRLQLGISDLLPANGDIERVRLVGKIVEEWNEENFG
jgi:hypothetical protein